MTDLERAIEIAEKIMIGHEYDTCSDVELVAQALLDLNKEIEDAPVAYGTLAGENFVLCGTSLYKSDTHKVRLVRIESIK